MSIVKNHFVYGPGVIGRSHFVQDVHSKKIMVGGGLKEILSSAWNYVKPMVITQLSNPDNQKKISDLLSQGVSAGSEFAVKKLSGGAVLSAKGQSKLESLLMGKGIRYLK